MCFFLLSLQSGDMGENPSKLPAYYSRLKYFTICPGWGIYFHICQHFCQHNYVLYFYSIGAEGVQLHPLLPLGPSRVVHHHRKPTILQGITFILFTFTLLLLYCPFNPIEEVMRSVNSRDSSLGLIKFSWWRVFSKEKSI